jgi:hypothetical protein
MDTFSDTVADVLMIGTIVFVVMFLATVMTSAGIYRLIKDLKRLQANDASHQKQLDEVWGRRDSYAIVGEDRHFTNYDHPSPPD